MVEPYLWPNRGGPNHPLNFSFFGHLGVVWPLPLDMLGEGGQTISIWPFGVVQRHFGHPHLAKGGDSSTSYSNIYSFLFSFYFCKAYEDIKFHHAIYIYIAFYFCKTYEDIKFHHASWVLDR
jgi:hypothetical protein